MSTSITQALATLKDTHNIHFTASYFQINLCNGRGKKSSVACVLLLCLLRLLPHMIFLSAHYCCSCNARLRIASRTKSLPLSDTTAFLSQTHCLLLLLVKMNSPRQLKVWTITSAVRKVRPRALQPGGRTPPYLHLSSGAIMESLGMDEEPTNVHCSAGVGSGLCSHVGGLRDAGWEYYGNVVKPLERRSRKHKHRSAARPTQHNGSFQGTQTLINMSTSPQRAETRMLILDIKTLALHSGSAF